MTGCNGRSARSRISFYGSDRRGRRSRRNVDAQVVEVPSMAHPEGRRLLSSTVDARLRVTSSVLVGLIVVRFIVFGWGIPSHEAILVTGGMVVMLVNAVRRAGRHSHVTDVE